MDSFKMTPSANQRTVRKSQLNRKKKKNNQKLDGMKVKIIMQIAITGYLINLKSKVNNRFLE